jgi:hypothetical protein
MHHLEPVVHVIRNTEPHASNVFKPKDIHYFVGRKMIAEVTHYGFQDSAADRVNLGVGAHQHLQINP